MISRFLQRMTLAAVLVGGVSLVLAQSASALPRPGAPRSRPEPARGFSLFAGSVGLAANANRVSCGLNNRGWQCTDYTNSSVLGGAYWPKGSPDQYVFNGGLQIAGVIPGTKASFAWAGDTVGAFFFDGTGFYQVGSGITNVYSSTNADDIANWPSAAYANDPTLYDPSLLGRASISEQDTWVRYWDGNTTYVLGRPHPMGLLVDQRTLAWNFPSGNQDILYFITRFINITATDPARYAGLTQYGYSAGDIADIVAVAQQFKAGMLGKFGVTIPDSGYWFTRVYAGPSQDPDVGSGGGGNYSTAVLPFSMDFAYTANFLFPTWQFPPSIFGAPFAVAPGFEGVKFLRGPENPTTHQQLGITMFTNTTNGGVFTDRANVQQLWRLAADSLIPADGACNAPVNTPLCQLVQGSADTRMYMYSGPLTIRPGESQVVVTAMVYAPAVAAAVASDGQPTPHTLGDPLFDLKPGFPGTPAGLVNPNSRIGQAGVLDTIRKIDRAVGWAVNAQNPGNSAALLDANGNGILEQTEIPTVPRSLLNKALVGQAVFDSKFLLPFAPVTPNFYLIPSDNQVTVVWQPSATESGTGDPYFRVASNSLSALYDPDYRAHDVEGYRIWRGRTQSQMTVIAQFDYAGTAMTDYTGQFSNDDYGSQCAPDIGVTTSCPATFFPHSVQLVGNVVQVPPGYHGQLITGGIINLLADTAVTGGNTGYPALRDTGVPFVYVDNTVLDGFTYYYAVTAFDVNSVKSGPSSLQSGLAAKSVTPRVVGGNLVAGTGSVQFDLVGSDGTVLNPHGAAPTLSATTGEFSGPALPSDGLTGLGFNFFADMILTAGQSAYILIDSLVPSYYHQVTYYLHGIGPAPVTATNGPAGDFGVENGDHTFTAFAVPLPANPDLADSLGLGRVPLAGTATGQVTIRPGVYSSALADWMGDVAGAFYASPTSFDSAGGSRWFTGANESTADPTLTLGGLGGAGSLPNVTFIYKPTPYHNADPIFRRYYGSVMLVTRAADIKVYWGNTAGKPDSVVDVTHHVRVPWNPGYRASWGIIKDFTNTTLPASGAIGAPNGFLSYHDFLFGPCFDGGPAGITTQGCKTRTLDSVATLLPVAPNLAATVSGTGFGMYINGEPFIFQTATLPQNTVWTYRSYYGEVTRTAGGAYGFTAFPSNPAVPGLRLRAMVTGTPSTFSRTASGSLAAVHTVPDPYYVTNALELTANTKVLRFVNLPSQAIIRIYSVSGILVNILAHNDASGGAEQVWNLRNRNNQFVASGVYFYHVETPDGQTKVGRFTVVNYAQ